MAHRRNVILLSRHHNSSFFIVSHQIVDDSRLINWQKVHLSNEEIQIAAQNFSSATGSNYFTVMNVEVFGDNLKLLIVSELLCLEESLTSLG